MERNRSDEKSRRKPSGAAVPRADLTEALYRAFFEEWAERGFAALSLERVAARAGAGKAAIYRRFSSRLAFAEAAISTLGLQIALPELEHPTLAEDLLALLLRARAVLRHPLARRILPDLHAEAARSAEMRAINDSLAMARREQAEALLTRAVGRGELPEQVDRDLALDLMIAPLYWRMVVRGVTPSRAELAMQSRAIEAGLKASTRDRAQR
ncbi:TetR-like C-terminal domain-containing protein [Sagittula stellata]|uniref:Putative tetR-family transcriptional regulator n=1 Tax=Sagittula stellata (strain ATCC 700073 / DSM 11524 / E-37) TaxID=388399 RepID=A3K180_SAGS3|nr:TetR-like C-terminal domain-containing protein [Sagittula stellata]EBA08676.1 putative tetR-family transcriptional regulator [Sagittula stellata E-37]